VSKEVVVFSADIDPEAAAEKPFTIQPSDNEAYGSFFDAASESGYSFLLCHPDRYLNGEVQVHWLRESGEWKIRGEAKVVSVWDRDCRDTLDKRPLFENLTAKRIPICNSWQMDCQLSDKFQNFYLAPDRIPFGLCLENPLQSLASAVDIFKRSGLPEDLSTEMLLLKPRHYYGGRGIVVLDDRRGGVPEQIPARGDYLLQSFLETSGGIVELGVSGRHDLRIVMVDGQPVLSYVRCPVEGGVISNVGEGGQIVYFDLEQLPEEALRLAAGIDRHLSKYPARMYSVDMAQGKSGRWWIFEINARPSFTWNADHEQDVSNKSKLHRIAIEWFDRHFGG